MNRYAPGKSYTCGCDIQRDNVGVHWTAPQYVTRPRCRQHGVGVTPAKGHPYDPAHPVHCVCNSVTHV